MNPVIIGDATLYHGDCRDVLRTLADNSIDSIVTDPPYALVSIVKRFGGANAAPAKDGDVYARSSAGFMGKQWDTGETAFAVEFWQECLRVLKPGGHVLAFSGSRTYHRLAVAIEDAGFEIRDQIMWLYGSGFPKSHNQPGGWGTALKPAHEPIVMARKPLAGTVAANVLAHGTGAINVDGCRVGWPDGKMPEIGTPAWGGPAKKLTAVPGQEGETVERSAPNTLGRWPANVIHDGSDEVVAGFPGAEARFFYCAKASKRDRDAGLEGLPPAVAGVGAMRDGGRASHPRKNTHPTVKPTDLMAYLCRLITPPGGVVLDPFMGSGSTGKAALREGFRFIGCEREDEYMPIAQARIGAAMAANDNTPPAKAGGGATAPAQQSLFDAA